jgi:transcriptional regulator
MYNPSLFVEDRIDLLHSFIRQHPLAVIVSAGSEGLEATHVPVILHADRGPKGSLRCHFARANDHWRTMQSSSGVLAIFQGPQHYITPSWYPSKQQHGKVVPTWNYVVVHVRGRASIFEEQSGILEHLRALTEQQERPFEKPWSVDDAPKAYLEGLSRQIVGVEISIEAIEGKCKISQNRSEQDRQGVVAGLTAMNTPASLEMAELVGRQGLE